MGAPDFFRIKDLNTRDNLCKDNFKPATIKNDNEAAAMSKCFVQYKQTNKSINKKKRRHRGIEYLLKCSTMF